MPHYAMSASSLLRLSVVEVSHSLNLMLEIFSPIAVLHAVVVLFRIVLRETRQYTQRIFHFVVKVFAHEILKSLGAALEQTNIVDDSRKSCKI